MHLSRSIKLADDITNINYTLLFFNTIHLSRSIKITDNLMYIIMFMHNVYDASA